MLKIWVYSANLRSYCSARAIYIFYLITLTSYLVLDITKQSVLASPAPPTAASLTEHPVPITLLPTAIADPSLEEELAPHPLPLIADEQLSLDSPAAEIDPIPTAPLAATTTEKVTPPPATAAAPLVPPSATPGYLIAPHPVKLSTLNSSATRIVINDVATSHRTQYEVTGGLEAGNERTTDPGLNATALFNPQVEESVPNNRVYRLDYRSNFTQLRTLRQQRDITTTTTSPETLSGSRQQISFIGDCLVDSVAVPSTTTVKPICSYTPGLKTDESSINPQKLIPTKITPTSEFGDIVTLESQVAMREAGFQAGANGQEIGVDLYFPRIGAQSGNSQGTDSSFVRIESSTTVPMVTVGRIHQLILANGTETAIARTIRGFNYILNDRYAGWNAAIQVASELLPDFEPSLPNGKKGGSIAVDRTLLLAANNNRTPENSFTAYYSGIGKGRTPKENQTGSSSYQGLWLGFSPITERQVSSTDPIYITTKPERIVIFSGGEGSVDNTSGANNNTLVTSLINQDTFSSPQITNAYVQAYLTTYEREVNTIKSTRVRESTNYYPHLSATGNVTTDDSVLRYYAGLILDPGSASGVVNSSKAYVGADFTKVAGGGISYNLAAIGYLNPDPEYHSNFSGSISKQFELGSNPAYSLGLSAGFNYALDGGKVFDTVSFRSTNSSINFASKANLGDVSIGLNYYLATGLPNSIGNLLSTSASWKINNNLVLSGYYTPINDNAFRSPFGVSANIKLGASTSSPTLALSWNHNDIDLGVGATNNRLGVSDNVLAVYIRLDK